MKILSKRFFAILITLYTFCINTYANDGVYYVSGNHLIPISETDIKISKEVLTIHLCDTSDYTYVDVDYTFMNTSSKPKTVKMGFEAENEDEYKLLEESLKGHPYIFNFSVEMNGKHINHTHEYAFYGEKGLDYKNFPVDKTKWTLGGEGYEELCDGGWDGGLMNKEKTELRAYAHVYYFEVTFQPGENKIHHTYSYWAGCGMHDAFTIKYWLKPASRWQGGKIDDFTLRISAYNTAKYFTLKGPFDKGIFSFASGQGKNRNSKFGKEFVIRNGVVEFNCKNFEPSEDLEIRSLDNYFFGNMADGSTEYKLGEFYDRGESFWIYKYNIKDYNDWCKRIIRNLPYASRGYVFKDNKLNEYFSQFFWYMPDPEWKPSQADFTKYEHKALEALK